MSVRVSTARTRRSQGSTLVEFAMVAFLVIIVLLSVVEMSRMMLTYTTVANSARAAARYAVVHGASRTGTGTNGPSGPGANPTEVLLVATNFAKAGLLQPASLTVNVTYPAGTNVVGSAVEVAVSYAYTPFVGLLPLSVSLSNTSRGVIVF